MASIQVRSLKSNYNLLFSFTYLRERRSANLADRLSLCRARNSSQVSFTNSSQILVSKWNFGATCGNRLIILAFSMIPSSIFKYSVWSLLENWIEILWDRTRKSFMFDSTKLHMTILSSNPQIFTFFIFEAMATSKVIHYAHAREAALAIAIEA